MQEFIHRARPAQCGEGSASEEMLNAGNEAASRVDMDLIFRAGCPEHQDPWDSSLVPGFWSLVPGSWSLVSGL